MKKRRASPKASSWRCIFAFRAGPRSREEGIGAEPQELGETSANRSENPLGWFGRDPEAAMRFLESEIGAAGPRRGIEAAVGRLITERQMPEIT